MFKLISFVVQFGDSFDDAVRQLAAVVQLNTDVCVAEGRVVMTNKCYAVRARRCYPVRPIELAKPDL